MAVKKILVIGGGRFIGKSIVDRLRADGHEITLVNRGTHGPETPPDQRIRADRDSAEFIQLLRGKKFDCVIDTCLYSPSQALKVATLLKQDLTPHYLFLSTLAVFGPASRAFPPFARLPLPPNPDAGYAQDKLLCQEIIEDACRARQVNGYTLYLPQIFGPHDYKLRELIPVNLLVHHKPFILRFHGQGLMPNGYVENIAHAVSLMVERPLPGIRPYLVAGGDTLTERDFVRFIATYLGENPRFYQLTDKILEGMLATRQIQWEWPYFGHHQVLDISPLVRDFGFTAPFDFRTGLQKTLNWLRESNKLEDLFGVKNWDLSAIDKFYRDFQEAG